MPTDFSSPFIIKELLKLSNSVDKTVSLQSSRRITYEQYKEIFDNDDLIDSIFSTKNGKKFLKQAVLNQKNILLKELTSFPEFVLGLLRNPKMHYYLIKFSLRNNDVQMYQSLVSHVALKQSLLDYMRILPHDSTKDFFYVVSRSGDYNKVLPLILQLQDNKELLESDSDQVRSYLDLFSFSQCVELAGIFVHTPNTNISKILLDHMHSSSQCHSEIAKLYSVLQNQAENDTRPEEHQKTMRDVERLLLLLSSHKAFLFKRFAVLVDALFEGGVEKMLYQALKAVPNNIAMRDRQQIPYPSKYFRELFREEYFTNISKFHSVCFFSILKLNRYFYKKYMHKLQSRDQDDFILVTQKDGINSKYGFFEDYLYRLDEKSLQTIFSRLLKNFTHFQRFFDLIDSKKFFSNYRVRYIFIEQFLKIKPKNSSLYKYAEMTLPFIMQVLSADDDLSEDKSLYRHLCQGIIMNNIDKVRQAHWIMDNAILKKQALATLKHDFKSEHESVLTYWFFSSCSDSLVGGLFISDRQAKNLLRSHSSSLQECTTDMKSHLVAKLNILMKDDSIKNKALDTLVCYFKRLSELFKDNPSEKRLLEFKEVFYPIIKGLPHLIHCSRSDKKRLNKAIGKLYSTAFVSSVLPSTDVQELSLVQVSESARYRNTPLLWRSSSPQHETKVAKNMTI